MPPSQSESQSIAFFSGLTFEQRAAIWSFYYATREARKRTLLQREERPNTPGSNAEMGVWLNELHAVNRNMATAHKITKAGLRRGLDGLVEAGLARQNRGSRNRIYWRLTSRGRALVGEPR